MMAQLKRGYCTARSTVLTAPTAMARDKSGEGGQTAVGLDPINDDVQPDVLQRGRAVMACQIVTGCESCYMGCEQYGRLIW